jgi:Zn-dependent protease
MRYIPNPRFAKKRNITFSRLELKDLFWAWLGISIAFANILSFDSSFLVKLILSGITVGLGFLLHELAHKVVAQKYGMAAEFRASYGMLFLAVLISFAGVIFAAPGAVLIMGSPSRKQNGIISIAGPLTNVAIALFCLLGMLFPVSLLVSTTLRFGFIINIWLALFNMLPFWVLDGKKVYAWNKQVYFLTLGLILVVFLFSGVM